MIVLGYLIGLTVTGDVVAATNSQVAGRVSPRLIDLLAALGALLLFVTNVVAIIPTGIVVMSIYGVNKLVTLGSSGTARITSLRKLAALLAAMLIVIGLPLSFTSADIASRSVVEPVVYDEVERWSADEGSSLRTLSYSRE